MTRKRKRTRARLRLKNAWQWNLRSYLLIAGMIAGLITLFAVSCTTTIPRDIDHSCKIFFQYPKWYRYAASARDRWQVSIGTQLAFIRQESRFRADAQPPRKKILWIIPWFRPSTAFGYPQAVNETWEWYRTDTQQPHADRDEFAAAVDFIGWYIHKTKQRLGIGKQKIALHYIVYHEGHAGYRNKSHHAKLWLKHVAQDVSAHARKYDLQLTQCEDQLKNWRWWWPF